MHGGKTHAREFYNALKRNKQINEIFIFPRNTKYYQHSGRNNLGTILRLILKKILPYAIKIQIKLIIPELRAYKELKRMILKRKPNVLIYRHSSNFRQIKWVRKDFPKLRIIIEYNASPFFENLANINFVKRWKKEEISCLLEADYISVVSSYLKHYLDLACKNLEQRIIVNPNGVDLGKFFPMSTKEKRKLRVMNQIPEDAIVFGYIGGMESFRRLPEVVEKFALLRKMGYNKIFLFLIGDGEDSKKVLTAISRNKSAFGNYVRIINRWIPHEEVNIYLNCFDIGVFPFTNPYVSPLKIFEYAACELPILGPDIPALKKEEGRELCNVLIKQDGSNFENEVIYLYKNINSLECLRKQKRFLIENRYSWDANVERVMKVL
jgi:glycosyltransferase involved in cell wall biosynthesis